jgi:hypothetical protein
MIYQQVLTLRFLVFLGIYLGICVVFALAARHYNRAVKKIKFSAGSFREPISHLMSAIGVLVPLVIGAMAYLVNRDAADSLATLMSASGILFLAFLCASWLTFALVSRSTDDDKIELEFPGDWYYRAASGVVYTGLVCGVLLVAGFFLFEFRATNHADTHNGVRILIERAAPRVGLDRMSVRSQLGEAQSVSNDGSTWTYTTDRSNLKIEFDAQGAVTRIIEEK